MEYNYTINELFEKLSSIYSLKVQYKDKRFNVYYDDDFTKVYLSGHDFISARGTGETIEEAMDWLFNILTTKGEIHVRNDNYEKIYVFRNEEFQDITEEVKNNLKKFYKRLDK